MPFGEEVPANYRASLPCKRRSCPNQDYYEDVSKGKRYFKYQCSDLALWCCCLRQIEVFHEPAKANPPPVDNPLLQPRAAPQPKPEAAGVAPNDAKPEPQPEGETEAKRAARIAACYKPEAKPETKTCGKNCSNYQKTACPMFAHHIPYDTELPEKCYGLVEVA